MYDGWLEPLLDLIAHNSSIVVCPAIDSIDKDTFEYQFDRDFQVGGFDWNLQFDWHSVPDHENKCRGHSWALHGLQQCLEVFFPSIEISLRN